jgi:hypothetical protein
MDGYNFGSDPFQGVKQSWNALLTDLGNDLAAAQRLVAVLAPGHEPASGFVAETQNTSGKALLDSITQMQAFVDGYVNNLAQNEKGYGALESNASQNLQNGMR